MNKTRLIDMILEYKKKNNDLNFNKILIKLNPLINEYLYKIPSKDKEDIKQEFYIEIFYKINDSKIIFVYLDEKLFIDENYIYL